MENTSERKVVRVKKPFMLGAALLLAVVGLQATPVSPASCPGSGSIAALVSTAGASCSLGDLVYSSFLSTNPDVVVISETNTTSLNGYLFSLPLAAGPGQTEDATLGYTITDTGANSFITGVTMPSYIGATINGGSASVSESVFGPGNVLLGTLNGPGSLSFADVNSVTIQENLAVTGNNGSADIKEVPDYVTLDPTPEPGFYGVLAAGVAGIFLFARRRKKTV
jgi:hypothetical protein